MNEKYYSNRGILLTNEEVEFLRKHDEYFMCYVSDSGERRLVHEYEELNKKIKERLGEKNGNFKN